MQCLLPRARLSEMKTGYLRMAASDKCFGGFRHQQVLSLWFYENVLNCSALSVDFRQSQNFTKFIVRKIVHKEQCMIIIASIICYYYSYQSCFRDCGHVYCFYYAHTIAIVQKYVHRHKTIKVIDLLRCNPTYLYSSVDLWYKSVILYKSKFYSLFLMVESGLNQPP